MAAATRCWKRSRRCAASRTQFRGPNRPAPARRHHDHDRDTSRIATTLNWTPQYADLETIAAHALAWEEKLFQERHGTERQAASA